MLKILLNILPVVVVLTGGGAAYILTLDFNSYKGTIQEEMRKAPVRDLVIAGDIDLESSLTTWLRISGARSQNGPW